ncbi:MAG: GNAT family N-acetyltransferase [Alphaproteobacteria bacterium]|nr:GNAT family N-acetyltransferase [Alphaproteobacteria bacterium]
MSIRLARPEDAPRLASVHITAWLETYRGIMPDKVLDELSLGRSTEGWSKRLAAVPNRQAVFVACNDEEQVIGFAAAGPKRLPELPSDGEIFAINLINSAKRKGYGLRLMQTAAEHLIANNFEAIGLWVLERNQAARAFYERLGGAALTQREERFGVSTLSELGIIWNPASALRDHATTLINA